MQVRQLLHALIACPSFDPPSSRLPEILLGALSGVPGLELREYSSGGIRNFVARTPGPPRCLFNGHWDTVPAEGEFVAPYWSENDAILHGLGACDMKSGLCAMITATLECARRGIPGVILCAVGDEESGGAHGTARLVEQGIVAPWVVIGEPTGLQLNTGQKGGFGLHLEVKGEGGHGAYPQRVDNTITKLMEVIGRLSLAFPAPKRGAPNEEVYDLATVTPTILRAGEASNVIPSSAVAEFDVRFPAGTDVPVLQRRIQESCRGDCVVTFSRVAHGWRADPSSTLFRAAEATLTQCSGVKPKRIIKLGSNDGKYYGAIPGCQVVNFGPGDSSLSHSGRERVSVSEVETCAQAYVEIARLASEGNF